MITYAFIINFNRLLLPSRMADWLADHDGIRPVIVDNCSTYPPLLEYYETTPHEVFHMDVNRGCQAVHGLQHRARSPLSHYDVYEHFIISDPDLDLEGIPDDWLQELELGLALDQPRAGTCGFGLRIDDVPAGVDHMQGTAWSRPFMGGRFYRASIDTTFALWRGLPRPGFGAVRTGPPYVARHVPWYYQTLDDLPEDERYYLASITPGKWNWFSGKLKEKLGL